MNPNYIFDVKSLILLTSAILNLTIFFYLLFARSRTSVNSIKYLALTTACVAIWMFASWVNHFSTNTDVVTFATRLSFTITIWAVIGFGLFGLNYNHKQQMTLPVFITGILASALTMLSNQVIEVGIPNLSGLGEGAKLGNLFWIWSIFLGSVAIFAIIVLIRTIATSTGVKRAKIILIVALFLISILSTLFFNLLLPNLGITSFMFIGQFSTLIFAFGSAWVVLQEHVYSLNYVVGNSLAIFIGAIILFVFSWGTQRIEYFLFHWDITSIADARIIIFGIFIALLVTIFINKYLPIILHSILKLFNINLTNFTKIRNSLVDYSNKSVNFERYAVDLLNQIKNNINSYGVSIYVPEIETIWSTDKDTPKINEQIIGDSGKITLLDDDTNSYYALIAPMVINKKAVAYLLCRQKANDGFYSLEEIDAIKELTLLLSITINRYIFYLKQKQFNLVLKKEVKLATTELSEKNEKLAEKMNFERDMLDILGHELRTPLGIVRNAVYLSKDLLKQEPLKMDKLSQYNEMAVENVTREIELLETLLSATKIDNNRLQLNYTKVDLLDVVHDSLAGLKEKANKKALKINARLPKEAFVFADRTRIQEVSDNLIDNAIKYTNQGSVTITVDKETQFTTFAVKDTGQGIPKADLPSIGKKFFRVDNYLKSSKDKDFKIIRPGGTGLGLYVTFSLIKNMGGKIAVESTEGEGSTFTATFQTYKDTLVAAQP